MYGSEKWPMGKKNESKIQAAEVRVLGIILMVTRRNND